MCIFFQKAQLEEIGCFARVGLPRMVRIPSKRRLQGTLVPGEPWDPIRQLLKMWTLTYLNLPPQKDFLMWGSFHADAILVPEICMLRIPRRQIGLARGRLCMCRSRKPRTWNGVVVAKGWVTGIGSLG